MKLALISQPTTTNALAAIQSLLDATTASRQSRPVNIGYVASAPDPEREYFKQTQQLYLSLGANMDTYLELETGFSQAAFTALLQCDVIHLSGGDTQRFLRAMKQRNMIDTIKHFADNGGAIVGVSAGAMLLTPSISSAALCGDSITDAACALHALHLVDFQFVPHATLAQTRQRAFQQQLQQLKGPTYVCADDDALVIIDQQLTRFGQPQWIQAVSS